ncbi:hypothetical protein CLAFUW4_02481 [Fulvia fulva]|uniref:Uncharacterized protein n=1 Tax=Passalora fulva TaxID=5499 RepID=A0A9Q8P4Z3_PASFU|nr:uncharacterized protein CLAFUR5_02471 [Fulvia fulva]KAK4632121.1 hypothetical protein CLAFUR4_02476 [Fulvia fulva]KAK4633700.1 hypothetical protein CLAFUR0_02480 [Fulvia fulva]UJO13605.1 hypothetical protein CLAFUR5_02471 [Fulvia fulva]WPV10817.1 hypothetical protein CLAFUW4_02481 [Fulvia fulva]WPV26604.1 hypothetical protein CLAFUW7_02481 [Fulvia fulva]
MQNQQQFTLRPITTWPILVCSVLCNALLTVSVHFIQKLINHHLLAAALDKTGPFKETNQPPALWQINITHWLFLCPVTVWIYWYLFLKFDPAPGATQRDYQSKVTKWTVILAGITLVLFVADVLLLTRTELVCPYDEDVSKCCLWDEHESCPAFAKGLMGW